MEVIDGDKTVLETINEVHARASIASLRGRLDLKDTIRRLRAFAGAAVFAPRCPTCASGSETRYPLDKETPKSQENRMSERTGRCQCGQVSYRFTGEPLFLATCHCTECQRQSGSAFGMSLIVPKANFTPDGTLKMFERSSDSGRPLRCFFCPECGTRIYHEPSYLQGVINIKPGTLDDTSWLAPKLQGWVSSKQPWAPLAEGIAQHPKQP